MTETIIYQVVKITDNNYYGRSREHIALHTGHPQDIENYYKYLRDKDYKSTQDWYDIQVTQISPSFIKPDLHKELLKREKDRLQQEMNELDERMGNL